MSAGRDELKTMARKLISDVQNLVIHGRQQTTESSVSPSSERMEGLWVVCGFIWREWSYAIGWNVVMRKT